MASGINLWFSPKEPHPLGPRCEVINMGVLVGDTFMWSYLSHKLSQIRGIGTLRYTALNDLGLPSRISMVSCRKNEVRIS